MLRRALLILLPVLLLCAAALADTPEMTISVSGDVLLPGEAVVVSLNTPEDGVCSIRLLDSAGKQVSAAAENRPVTAGYNAMYWNGTWQGVPAPEGRWRLVLEMNGDTAETPLTIGRMLPFLVSSELSASRVTSGRRVTARFCATEAADVRLRISGPEGVVRDETCPAEQGDGEIQFDAAFPPGEYTVTLTLERDDGTASDPAALPLAVEDSPEAYRALGYSGLNGEDWSLNAWTLPMDITDEEAVWQALTSPVTVLDNGKSNAQRMQLTIRSAPSEDSSGVGVVTLTSQGVHVLERGEEWSLIECFSASFHDSAVLNWNAPVRGYVPTKYLKEVVPNQQMGLVVDKLTQRLYIFMDGSLYTTLQVSTGLANERQPYNETRSGEYLLVSQVGGFYSDNMYCPLAIRFNDGDLLHEVPYVTYEGTLRDYSSTEPKLGSRASHGCIRVQRKKNPEGVNQQWIWNHYSANTKILIWEDWQGRSIPVPDDDTVMYVNSRKNDYYHCSPRCEGLGTRSPRSVTYAELSGETYAKTRACPYCGPSPKKEKLMEINALYAPGGDHDPIMTEARKSCPRLLKER